MKYFLIAACFLMAGCTDKGPSEYVKNPFILNERQRDFNEGYRDGYEEGWEAHKKECQRFFDNYPCRC